MECLLVLATWALVIVTAYFMSQQIREQARIGDGQIRTAAEQLQAFRADLGVRLLLIFVDRFESPRLVEHRQALSHQLQLNAPDAEIKEAVMNLFEDIGLMFREKYLSDGNLIWCTFGTFAVGWWGNCRPYVMRERERKKTILFSKNLRSLQRACPRWIRKEGLVPRIWLHSWPTNARLASFMPTR